MSIIDSNNELLREQLGKGTVEIVVSGDGAQTGKDYYSVYFAKTTTVSAISVNGSAESKLLTTYAAGVTLFMRITALTITSGLAICYVESDLDATA